LQTQAQPTTAATPFEQLSQQQPSMATAASGATKPGTILLTTFPNGTSKAQFANGTTVQILSGVGYLVLDPSASAAASASASAPVSNTVVNRFYQAIAIAIGITINATDPDPIIPIPPQPNTTEPRGPDERCLFDPSLPHCTPPPGEDCPEGLGTNEDGQCFPLGGCPDGYHSNEDDETGTCYPDSEPCPEGQVRSDEGNYCVVPEEPDPISCPAVFPPPPGCPGLEDLEPEQQCEIDPSLPDCIENEDQQIDNSEESAELEPAPPEEDVGDESGNNEGGDSGNNEGGDSGNNEGGGDDSDDDE
jgi:hypothetical protein